MTIRRTTFYLFLAVQIALVVALVVSAGYIRDTRENAEGTRGNLAIGCDRANRTREALHYLATTREPAVPGWIIAGLNLTEREKPRSDKPWLVDCRAAYP